VCESEAASLASVDGPAIEPTTSLVLQESTDVMENFTEVMGNTTGDEEFQVNSCVGGDDSPVVKIPPLNRKVRCSMHGR